ncbi:MAG TPA: VanZ family protein, partial [Candidatus Binatus sp.]|nr:VanZ family protein [Candidatus Binatus sp.]
MHFWIRKLAHFTEYLILSTLLYRGLRGSQRWSVRAAVLALAMAGVYAVGDEFHQWFVPGRTAAATDCLIDVSGAAAGQGLLAAWARVLRT